MQDLHTGKKYAHRCYAIDLFMFCTLFSHTEKCPLVFEFLQKKLDSFRIWTQ